MEIYNDISNQVPLHRPVVTIGTFDGVHIGHQAIFQAMKDISDQTGGDVVVVTFNPHPRIVLGHQVYLLSTLEEKRTAFQQQGISHLIEIPFTKEFAKQSADEFIEWIAKAIQPEIMVIGYDHGFGRDRSGGIEHLYRYGKQLGFKVIQVNELLIEKRRVSSSTVRWLLQEGQAKEAARLLGRLYEISGQVIRGNQIGKLIGYPTANLYIDDPNKLIPAMGVYASKVIHNNQVFDGMTNIGMRPTINAYKLTIETNIFDFDEDIYYEPLTIQLVKRIRNEKKFGNLDLLKAQLYEDQVNSMSILREHP